MKGKKENKRNRKCIWLNYFVEGAMQNYYFILKFIKRTEPIIAGNKKLTTHIIVLTQIRIRLLS
jgi:hypothetical protein